MASPPLVAGLILAGGRSRRMGTDKASLDWHGKPLLRHIVDVLVPRLSPLLVAARPGQTLPGMPDAVLVRHDLEPFQGPLVAIDRALTDWDSASSLFITGCDYPCLRVGVVDFLAAHLGGYDVVVPRLGGQAHPLLALYRTPLGEVIRRVLARGQRSMVALLDTLNVRWVEEAEWQAFDPPGTMLRNINTPLEYAEVLKVTS